MERSIFDRIKSAKPVDEKRMKEATRYYNEQMTFADMEFQSKNRDSEVRASFAILTT